MTTKPDANEKLIGQNRKARHDYFIEDTIETGLVLTGTEVKSLRQGRISMVDSYAKIDNGELYMVNCHIDEYTHGNRYNHDPLRQRKLLAHKREILKLTIKIKERGFTLIPLKMYFKNGKAKVLLGLAKGKRKYDKRDSLKKEEMKREIAKMNKFKD